MHSKQRSTGVIYHVSQVSSLISLMGKQITISISKKFDACESFLALREIYSLLNLHKESWTGSSTDNAGPSKTKKESEEALCFS